MSRKTSIFFKFLFDSEKKKEKNQYDSRNSSLSLLRKDFFDFEFLL